jgi:hypothetical protein
MENLTMTNDDATRLTRVVDAALSAQSKLDVVSLALMGLADGAPPQIGNELLSIKQVLDEAMRELEAALRLGDRPPSSADNVGGLAPYGGRP